MADERTFILASASTSRQRLLQDAGLDFEIVPSTIDEDAIKQAFFGDDLGPDDLALVLAQAKASDVSRERPARLVIGADQILHMAGEIYSKPEDMAAARDQLLDLRGRTHRLETAVAAARDGQIVWDYVDGADMTMRDFSNEFLGAYLAGEGAHVLTSVGAYQVEGHGIQLFSEISGDHGTIRGLPMLPLLSFLREQGCAKR